MRKIYPANEVDKEIEALRLSVEAEIAEEGPIGGHSFFGRLRKALSSVVVRRGLVAGVICQVAQQFVGINTVMYYSPTIVQLAGFASNSTAMALSLITSGLNALGSIVSMYFVDRAGRRRLLLVSLIGIMVCLACLSGVFFAAATHSPAVGEEEARPFGNFTCPDLKPVSGTRWKCMDCVRATSDCGFCAHAGNKVSIQKFLILLSILRIDPDVYLLNLFAASSWSMPCLRSHSSRCLSRRRSRMVHSRLPEQLRMASSHCSRSIHHLLLPRHGHCAMDHQLGNLPSAIPRPLQRVGRSCQLGLEPDRLADISKLDRGIGHGSDIPFVLWSVCRRLRLHLLACSRNQRLAIRTSGGDAGN